MNIKYAEESFERYLDQYDRENDKIKLKIVHTYGVVKCMDEITRRMGLPEEERELARLIAFLHDIGRFEQLKRFGSFEPGVMDHAAYGVKILFEDGMIREFIKEDTYDEIIKTAIAKHSDYKLEGIEDERTLLHAKLIRDADKLDNCRVKLEDTIETLLDVSPEELGREEISPEILEQVYRKETIVNAKRKTKMDYWVSYVAYFFDINFKETMRIIHENQFINKIIQRVPYSNAKTEEEMKKIGEFINNFISESV
jgi:hypothetical protein